MLNKGRENAQNFNNAVEEKMRELPGKMVQIGKYIVDGIIQGINNETNRAKSTIQNFGNGLVDGLKSKLGIHSPSRVFRDEIGKFIPQGIAVGVRADTKTALEAINNMNKEIMSEMNKAVAIETGSINASASVKSNNSMLSVIKATFNIDGSINMDGKKVGRTIAPSVVKTIKAGGLTQ